MKDFFLSLASFAPVVTACAAVIAITIAVFQLRTVRQNEAKRQYSLFLLRSCETNVDNRFVSGEIERLLDSGDEKDKYDLRKYKWYLASFLMAAEEILDAFRGDGAWNETIEGALRIHRLGLGLVDENCYSYRLKHLILKVRDQYAGVTV